MNLQKVYHDNLRYSDLQILQVDEYSVQVEYQDAEIGVVEYDKEEVATFLKNGVWSVPEVKETVKPVKKQAPAPPESRNTETFTAYISSMKALKEGSYARITLENKKSYFEVEVTPKSGTMEIDLTKLDRSQIDKIMAVLNEKPKEANNE